MTGVILSLAFLFIFLYGYYLGIKPSKLERDIRKTNSDYECFKCKKIIHINDTKCPNCNFVTIYGQRRKKFFLIFPILIGYAFMLVKFNDTGLFLN